MHQENQKETVELFGHIIRKDGWENLPSKIAQGEIEFYYFM